MAWMQPNSQDLANMLPGPRFQPEPAPAAQARARTPSFSPTSEPTEEEQLIAQQRERRLERRRMKQASPGEGRNARQSATGESDGSLVSPARSLTQGPPQLSSPGPDSDTDMTRFGLAAEVAEAPSPTARQQRRRMASAERQSPEPRTPSEYGSEGGSPSRRVSRTDMLSSRDSLESLTGGARAGRRGSGFKKGGPKQQQQPAIKTSIADLHIVGEIVGASGFDRPMLFCRWEVLYDESKSWKVVRGMQKGATHACCSDLGEVDLVVWEHPLDIHMQTQSLQGWPMLRLMIYSRDESINRNSFVSYALVNVPNTPGLHHVSCQTWFAVETNRALGRSFFGWHTGLIPRLEDEGFITDHHKREDAMPFVCTVGAGEVHLRLSILTRHLHQVTHQGGESLAAALERLNTNIRRSAAMEERRRSHDSLSEGLKAVRSGRDERFEAARLATGSRRKGEGPSPPPSDISRAPSLLDRAGRSSSFRGFTSVRDSGSPKRLGSDTPTGADDNRSEASNAGGRRGRRDRFAEFTRRDADRRAAAAAAAAAATAAAAQEGEGAVPAAASADGGSAAGDGTGVGLSRAASVRSDAAPPRSNSGGLSRAGSRSGAAGTAGPGPAAGGAAGAQGPRSQAEEDDGLETIDGGEQVQVQAGSAVPSDVTVAREAERFVRRARQRAAF